MLLERLKDAHVLEALEGAIEGRHVVARLNQVLGAHLGRVDERDVACDALAHVGLVEVERERVRGGGGRRHGCHGCRSICGERCAQSGALLARVRGDEISSRHVIFPAAAADSRRCLDENVRILGLAAQIDLFVVVE